MPYKGYLLKITVPNCPVFFAINQFHLSVLVETAHIFKNLEEIDSMKTLWAKKLDQVCFEILEFERPPTPQEKADYAYMQQQEMQKLNQKLLRYRSFSEFSKKNK